MRTTVTVAICVAVLVCGMGICGQVSAGPLENASEFQDEVIQQQEEQSMNEPGAGAGSITWGDDSVSGDVDAGAGEQAVQ
jgi:hypothetical protein